MFRSLATIALVLIGSAAFAGGKPFPPREQIDAAKQLVAETFSKELSQSDKAPAVKAMLVDFS